MQPRARGIEQRTIVCDVLFLYHADFQVQVARHSLRLRVAQIHVEVHGLLLASGEDECAQRRTDVGRLGVAGGAHGVARVAVMRDGRAAWRDLDGAAHQIMCRLILVKL